MTLDQLIALQAIVSTGTFRGAAEQLNKAQSAISHQIRKLEDELQFELFSRDTYRPQLTTEGEAYFREAARVLEQVSALQETANGLREMQEATVRIAISATICLDPFLQLLGGVGRKYPGTHIRVAAEMMGGPVARLMEGEADLIVAGLEGVPIEQVKTLPVGSVIIRPVAHKNFPAARISGVRSRREMQTYVQVVVSGTGGRDFEQSRDLLTGAKRWSVSDFVTKKSIIGAELGWGGMPEHMIEGELASGEFVSLDVEGFPPRHTEVFAIRRRDQEIGRVMSEIWMGLKNLTVSSTSAPIRPRRNKVL